MQDRWGPRTACTGMLNAAMPQEEGVTWDGDQLHPHVLGYAAPPLLRVVQTLVRDICNPHLSSLVAGYDDEETFPRLFGMVEVIMNSLGSTVLSNEEKQASNCC